MIPFDVFHLIKKAFYNRFQKLLFGKEKVLKIRLIRMGFKNV